MEINQSGMDVGEVNDGDTGYGWEYKNGSEATADFAGSEDKMYLVRWELKAGNVLDYNTVEMVEGDAGVDGDNMSSIDHHNFGIGEIKVL